MDTTLSLLFSVLLNCIIAEFVNAGACSPANTPVIGACTSSNNVNVSTIYIDGGTAPLYEDRICICDIAPHTGLDTIVVYNTWNSDKGHQTVEILEYLFNRTIYSGEFVITGKTNIVIKTDGVGGVCVKIYTVSMQYMDVSCYLSGSTTAGTKQSTISPATQSTAQSTRVKTTATVLVSLPSSITTGNQTEWSSSLSISTSFVSLSSKTDEQDENSLIGPVAGAVGGGIVMIAAVIIVVLCKRKRILNKKKSQGNNTLPTISPQNVAEDPYFDMTENPMYDRTDLHTDDIHETKRTNTQHQNIESNNGTIVAEEKTGIYVNNNMNNVFHSANTEDLPRNINISEQSDTEFPQYAVVQRRNKP